MANLANMMRLYIIFNSLFSKDNGAKLFKWKKNTKKYWSYKGFPLNKEKTILKNNHYLINLQKIHFVKFSLYYIFTKST